MSDNELLAIARQIGFNVEKVSIQLMLKAFAEQIKVKMLDKEAA